MDAKVFRLTLLTIISAFLLVIVILYATNADKINKMFVREKSGSAAEEYSGETVPYVDEESYAQQIGDDLKSFLYDEDFFDEAEQIPAVVVIQQNTKTVEEATDNSSEQEIDEDSVGMAVDTVPGGISLEEALTSPLSEEPVEGTPVGKVP